MEERKKKGKIKRDFQLVTISNRINSYVTRSVGFDGDSGRVVVNFAKSLIKKKRVKKPSKSIECVIKQKKTVRRPDLCCFHQDL